ncbi:MAG: hypothetical protein F4Y02_01960 [Chloroflexi bacterium]|nr:hypothetical protein [Chloroflexota bacterium]
MAPVVREGRLDRGRFRGQRRPVDGHKRPFINDVVAGRRLAADLPLVVPVPHMRGPLAVDGGIGGLDVRRLIGQRLTIDRRRLGSMHGPHDDADRQDEHDAGGHRQQQCEQPSLHG